jgi:hypothetical protein
MEDIDTALKHQVLHLTDHLRCTVEIAEKNFARRACRTPSTASSQFGLTLADRFTSNEGFPIRNAW